ncbi:FtsX-like permease family protein [Streptomyces sp. NPDC097619]|uniref:FtsX-like permease family protein n=1 Tax=Streptomyces sp. NPDC097619 TaxID=3157228 RepID=UPI003330748E
MNAWYHSWIAAIRIARRDAWRSKGRSALVLAMLALPIIGVSAADLTLRSAELSTTQRMDRLIGAADVRLSDSHAGGRPVLQAPDGTWYQPATEDTEDTEGGFSGEVRADLRKAVPAGAQVLADTQGSAKVRTRYGLLDTIVHEIDAGHPLAAGLVVLDRGRYPAVAGEVAATTRFLEESGLYVGSRVVPRGSDRAYLITGAYELPDTLSELGLIAPPGTFLAPLAKELAAAGLGAPEAATSLLVRLRDADGRREGFTWNMVEEANTHSVLAVSRAVALDPPDEADVPLYRATSDTYERSPAFETTTAVTAATVVGLALLEVCLLAGPAFAVGARRSRRRLGLVGANGGERRHIRAVVLSGGLVLGAVAAVVGTALGVALTLLCRPLLEHALGARFGSFDVRPLELLGIALLAVLTGLLAAVVPAVAASRQSVLSSLTGRRGIRKANRVLPVIGFVAVLGGAAIALFGSVSGSGFMVVAGGSALAELGVVALVPTLVGLFGRLGRVLPLSPRLALRDAVRNRGRTAPAVAAVLAAVAGSVAVATYQESRETQVRQEYRAQLPAGSARLSLDDSAGFRELPAARAAVTRELPVAVRADVSRIVIGRSDCEEFSADPACGRLELVVPPGNNCPMWEDGKDSGDFTPAQRERFSRDWRCLASAYGPAEQVAVADERLLTALAVTDPAARAALREGTPVAFDRRYVKDGRVTLLAISDPAAADKAAEEGREVPGVRRTLPVHLVSGDRGWGFKVVLPPDAAKKAGLAAIPSSTYLALDGSPTSEQRQRADAALDTMSAGSSLYIEDGYQGSATIMLLALSLFAGVITIGAAGIATGLSQADTEADLRTLAAVGAAPRVRRTLSAFQCGVVAAMGVLLGSAAGILPAVALRLTERRQQAGWYADLVKSGFANGTAEPVVPIVVPWVTLAGLLVAVPVGAALLAALVTRSNGALGRRAAT